MTTPAESKNLNRLVERCGGSESGAKWLKLAIDPFHDVDLELVGFPDQTPGRSVIYNVTKNITVTKPTGLADTAKFDAHVSFLPIVGPGKDVSQNVWRAHISSLDTTGATSMVRSQALNAKYMEPGIIQVCTVPAGTNTFQAGVNEEYRAINYSALLDNDGSSISRLIGCAFEVHNTTEELHKSGAVTVYRYDNNKDNESIWLSNWSNHSSDPFTSAGVHGPPTNEANAKLLNGITWEAAEGCLVPCVMDTENEPQKFIPRRNHFIVNGPDGPEGPKIYWTQDAIDNTVVMFGPDSYIRPTSNTAPSMILPFMGCGAYFTGLSAQTSLTVTMRAFVEVFPGPANPLVPLAHPSSPYDAKVLQCYSEVMAELHAGYPVRDNAAGDFFRKAYDALKTTAEVGQMIPGLAPIAEAASSGFQAGEKFVKAVKKKTNKKKKNGS